MSELFYIEKTKVSEETLSSILNKWKSERLRLTENPFLSASQQLEIILDIRDMISRVDEHLL